MSTVLNRNLGYIPDVKQGNFPAISIYLHLVIFQLYLCSKLKWALRSYKINAVLFAACPVGCKTCTTDGTTQTCVADGCKSNHAQASSNMCIGQFYSSLKYFPDGICHKTCKPIVESTKKKKKKKWNEIYKWNFFF